MPPNGHSIVPREIPQLDRLPRPVYARVESLGSDSWSAPHSHPWVQFSYAIQGVLGVHTAEGSYVAPPQRAIWVPAGLQHQVGSNARAEMRSLYIEQSAAPWMPARCQVVEVSPLTRELIRSFTALPSEYAEEGADGRLVQVLLDQLRQAEEVSLSLPLPVDERLRVLCESLQADPADGRDLGYWAARIGVSEKTLSRIFLRETGLSFRAWRQRLRLLHALAPLENGERVTDVALSCGYESTSAFITAFRQHFGCTPGEFFNV